MPNKEFLETYPLYKKYRPSEAIPNVASRIDKVRLNMFCPICLSGQTFVMVDEYVQSPDLLPVFVAGTYIQATYKCQHCTNHDVKYYLLIADRLEWIMKVGQHPPLDSKDDPAMRSFLKDNYQLFKSGVRCESFNFGIGAFAYYRRVVEYVVDRLLLELEKLGRLSNDSELLMAIEHARNEQRATERLNLLKEHVPVILRPNGLNPLARLYAALSVGIHNLDDEACLSVAANIRATIEFVVRTLEGFHQERSRYIEEVGRLP